jgi:hypothetical protein
MASKVRSLFKRKGKGKAGNVKYVDGDVDDIPPMVAPIDPDGSGESHSSAGKDRPEKAASSSEYSNNTPEAAEAATVEQRPDPDRDGRYYGPPNIPRRQVEKARNKSRDGVPIITSEDADVFTPSAVSSKTNYATGGFYSKSKQTFLGRERPKVRPSAKKSAFGGAPRYDWMDIVSCGGGTVLHAVERFLFSLSRFASKYSLLTGQYLVPSPTLRNENPGNDRGHKNPGNVPPRPHPKLPRRPRPIDPRDAQPPR